MAHQVPTLSGLVQSDTTNLSESIPERDANGDIFASTFRGSVGLRTAGGLYLDTRAKTSSFTVDDTAASSANSTHFLCDATSGALTITLQAATSVTDKYLVVTKSDSSANTVIIEGNSTETLSGTLTLVLYRQYDCAVVHCDGTGWHVVSRPRTLFCAVAASAAVSDTVVETAFDQSITLAANTLKAGDRIKFRAQVIATSTNSTDTLNIKLKIGSTVVAATGALDATNNDIAYIEGEIVIRTSGASGTLVAAGVAMIGVEGTATAKPFKLASTAVDTTATQAITVTAQWSVANAGNSVRLDVLSVERA